MGELIRFPMERRLEQMSQQTPRRFSPEEQQIIDIVSTKMHRAIRRATVNSGSLEYGPNLARQAEDTQNYTISPLGSPAEYPDK